MRRAGTRQINFQGTLSASETNFVGADACAVNVFATSIRVSENFFAPIRVPGSALRITFPVVNLALALKSLSRYFENTRLSTPTDVLLASCFYSLRTQYEWGGGARNGKELNG